jgi:hypothetical protein
MVRVGVENSPGGAESSDIDAAAPAGRSSAQSCSGSPSPPPGQRGRSTTPSGFVSILSLGDGGWAQVVNFIVGGVLIAGLGLGLGKRAWSGRGRDPAS